eukprot:10214639-Karenia_brevis.AAC.1
MVAGNQGGRPKSRPPRNPEKLVAQMKSKLALHGSEWLNLGSFKASKCSYVYMPVQACAYACLGMHQTMK